MDDVLIIGASLAGIACAVTLHENDHKGRLAILDEHPPSRNQADAPASVNIGTRTLPETFDFAKPHIQGSVERLHLGTPRVACEATPASFGQDGPLGFVLDHERLRRDLASRAKKAGAEFYEGRLEQVQRVCGRTKWELLTGTNLYHARVLVGAHDDDLVRHATIDTRVIPERHPTETLVACEMTGRARDARDGLGQLEVYWDVARWNGYYWSMRATDDTRRLGCATTEDASLQRQASNVESQADWWRGQNIPSGGPRRFDASRPPLENVVGTSRTSALVGPAAFAPIAGIHANDVDALHAGARLADAIHAGDLGRYERWWRRHEAPRLRRRQEAARRLIKATPGTMDEAIEGFAHRRSWVRFGLRRDLRMFLTG